MTLGGVWACQWRELRPVKFGGSAAPNNKVSGGVGGQEQDGAWAGDEIVLERGEGEGYEVGGHRGRGRDGGGIYEMVGMK